MSKDITNLARDLLSGNLHAAVPLLDALEEDRDSERRGRLVAALAKLTVTNQRLLNSSPPARSPVFRDRDAVRARTTSWRFFTSEVRQIFWLETLEVPLVEAINQLANHLRPRQIAADLDAADEAVSQYYAEHEDDLTADDPGEIVGEEVDYHAGEEIYAHSAPPAQPPRPLAVPDHRAEQIYPLYEVTPDGVVWPSRSGRQRGNRRVTQSPSGVITSVPLTPEDE